MTAAGLCGCVFVGLCVCAFVLLYPFVFGCLCICVFVHSSVSMLPLRKRHRSVTPAASTVSSPTTPNHTPTKKPRVAPLMPIKGRAAGIIARAIAGSSCPVPVHSRPLPVKFPPIDQIWRVLGDLDSSQYLKSASTHEEYARLIKYFHAHLVLVFRGLHLPEVKAIFRATLPP